MRTSGKPVPAIHGAPASSTPTRRHARGRSHHSGTRSSCPLQEGAFHTACRGRVRRSFLHVALRAIGRKCMTTLQGRPRSLPAPSPPVVAAAPEQEEQYNDDEEGFHGGVAPFRIGCRARAMPSRGTTRNSRKPFVDALSAVETAVGAVRISTICETKLLTQRWLGRAGSLAVVRPPAAYGPGPPRLEPSTRGSFREKGRLLEPKSPSDRNVTLVCTRQGPGNSHCRPTVDIDNAGCQPHRGRFCPDPRARCDSGDRQLTS